jgi:hypothetical protein
MAPNRLLKERINIEKRIVSSFWQSLEIPRSFVSSSPSKEDWGLSRESEGWLLRRPRENYPTIYLGLGFLQTLFLFLPELCIKVSLYVESSNLLRRSVCVRICSIPPQPRV